MKYGYAKSVHEKVAEEVFPDSSDISGYSPIPCMLIGFVNRSGSNYLAELLRSTGAFTGLEEPLNDHSMRVLGARFGARTLADYVIRLHREQTRQKGQVWGMKVGWMQLAMLLRAKLVPDLLLPRMIVVRRRDVVSQAISLYIAERTAQWTTNDAQVRGRGEVEYDGQRILNTLRGIVQSYASLQQVAVLGSIPFNEVYYEDLMDCPSSVVSRLTETMSGKALAPRPDIVRIGIQRDTLDYDLKARFLTDLTDLRWEAS